MSIVQRSKTQIRRGLELDLPGSPTSLTPLVFSPGLAVGELSFTVDTGRVFIGHNPAVGQVNFERTELPYQNIEVLTENSSAAVRRVFGRVDRLKGRSSLLTATLPVSSAYSELMYSDEGNPTSLQVLGEHLNLSIEYFLFRSDGTPLKQGRVRFISDEFHVLSHFTDDYVKSSALTNDTQVEFRAVRIPRPNDETYHQFEYRNNQLVPVTMYFRVLDPLRI